MLLVVSQPTKNPARTVPQNFLFGGFIYLEVTPESCPIKQKLIVVVATGVESVPPVNV